MNRARSFVFVFIAALSGASCHLAKPPALAAPEARQFAQDYARRLATDLELAEVLASVDDAALQPSGLTVVVRIHLRKWVGLTRDQRDRLVRTMAMQLMEACRPYQADRGRVCRAQFMDDLGMNLGWALAGGTSPDGYRFEFLRL